MNPRDSLQDFCNSKIHEDRIADKGFSSMLHNNLVHNFYSDATSNEDSGRKSYRGRGMEKSSRQSQHGIWKKSKAKRRLFFRRKDTKRKSTLPHLMDICHLKNAELEPKFQKYQGRVVLRGDVVKDDSGAYAVFSEQGSSASQMTAAKIMDVIAR